MKKTLLVNELFVSIQGESTRAGTPCFFVRLTGCNLRCRYCDTVFARNEGREIAITDIVSEYILSGVKLCEITGGEPLLQKNTPELCVKLLKRGAVVMVETNGSIDISVLPFGVIRVIDVKCPSSGEKSSFFMGNIRFLRKQDEIKFVVSDREDFDWAITFMQKHNLDKKVNAILFSPVYGVLRPKSLAEWLIKSAVNARMQLQMHKLIGVK